MVQRDVPGWPDRAPTSHDMFLFLRMALLLVFQGTLSTLTSNLILAYSSSHMVCMLTSGC